MEGEKEFFSTRVQRSNAICCMVYIPFHAFSHMTHESILFMLARLASPGSLILLQLLHFSFVRVPVFSFPSPYIFLFIRFCFSPVPPAAAFIFSAFFWFALFLSLKVGSPLRPIIFFAFNVCLFFGNQLTWTWLGCSECSRLQVHCWVGFAGM